MLDAILAGKCPRCRKGDMFPYRPYDLKRFSRMNRQCPSCGLVFETEPGFFYGAMYVSYAFSVFILFLMGLVVYLLFEDPPVWVYGIFASLPILILHPFIYRYSRIVYIHLFGGIHYRPDHDDK